MSADLPESAKKDRGVNREWGKRFDWSLNNTINWDYTFNDVHHVMVTLAQEAEDRRYWVTALKPEVSTLLTHLASTTPRMRQKNSPISEPTTLMRVLMRFLHVCFMDTTTATC